MRQLAYADKGLRIQLYHAGDQVVAVARPRLAHGFVADDSALPVARGEDVVEVGDLELELGRLVDDLLALEGRQAD